MTRDPTITRSEFYGGVDEEFILNDHQSGSAPPRILSNRNFTWRDERSKEHMKCSKLSPFMGNYCPKLYTNRDVVISLSPSLHASPSLLSFLQGSAQTDHLHHDSDHSALNQRKQFLGADRFILGKVLLFLYSRDSALTDSSSLPPLGAPAV